MLSEMSWLNEPGDWTVAGDVLSVVTENRTDFWRETFYDWITDNGHFYHRPVTGDFSAEAMVSADHEVRFDQAGMMVCANERTWLKTSLEVTFGAPWQLLRLAHLDLPETVAIGLMCCSLERAGLRATFRGFTLGPPPPRDGLE